MRDRNDTARILLIEDSETQGIQLQYLLENEGLQVDWVKSGEAGLDYLNNRLPDFIVLDYHLPGMRGDQFCGQVRMNTSTRNIPILMLTGDNQEVVERQGLESGADDHIPKTVEPAILLMRINALLREAHMSPLTAGASAHFRRPTLLIVDDSSTYLTYLTSELVQEGYAIDTAASADAALQQVKQNQDFDCILVDLVMPYLDGIALSKRLDQIRKAISNPFAILMITGQDNKDDMMRSLEAGADDFISKANDIVIIKARIRAALRRKFLHQENQRIIENFRAKELELAHVHAEKEAAEIRAAFAAELEQANQRLETANRELRETQTQLIQSAKMASLGQLVAGIAHEINNPLSFVMSHLLTVENRLQGVIEEVSPHLSKASAPKLDKIRQRLQDMHMGLERVKDLVVKLRTFSRIDEGEFNIVSIRENIESVLTLLQHRLKDRIRLRRQYSNDDTLACYPSLLNQAFMNILSNAIDAIEGQGEITITTGRMDSQFFISIADTGPGISDILRERIFEPFFTTKPIGAGTGLGLAITYRIIQKHEGYIEAHNRKAGGTEIIIKLPVDKSHGT